ncbi:MAG TPA: hypothetical protein VLR71_10130, partial [Casimicrobiaceae bacterium]|nr:hypothetical protein [Casimicrobiaceae bacterium]
ADTRITNIDADGVALAALHALQQRARDQDAAITQRAARIAALRARLAALQDTAADVSLLRRTLAQLLRSAAQDDAKLRTVAPRP